MTRNILKLKLFNRGKYYDKTILFAEKKKNSQGHIKDGITCVLHWYCARVSRIVGIVICITQDHSRSFEVNYEGRLAIVITEVRNILVRNNTNNYTLNDLLS